MSKQQKLLTRFKKRPSQVDFTWEDFVTLMKTLNFTESCSGGSHYIFEHKSGYKFSASKTHPKGVLKMYQFKDAIAAMKAAGECSDEKGENEDEE